VKNRRHDFNQADFQKEAVTALTKVSTLDNQLAAALGKVTTLTKVSTLDNQSVEVAAALGNAYQILASIQRQKGDEGDALNSAKQAEVYFALARNLDPTYPDTFFNWANLLADNNRCKEALHHFQSAANLKPLDLETYSNWARTLANMGKYTEALKVIRPALTGVLAQTVRVADDSLAYAFSNHGAILDLSLHHNSDPSLHHGSDPSADAEAPPQILLGEQAAAYHSAVAAKDNYPEAHFHLSRVYDALKRPNDAKYESKIYKKILFQASDIQR
jgi:tetratricopeptide (TPR) repeat protein